MDQLATSRRPAGEQGASAKVAPQSLELVSLRRRVANGTLPARIIWLDDEESYLKRVPCLFADWFKDYSFVPCLNGDEALREVEQRPPDLLLTDYRHIGVSLERMLLRLEASPVRFPILLASASVQPETLSRLRSSCTFTIEFLCKPFDCEDLFATMIKCLNSSNGLLTA